MNDTTCPVVLPSDPDKLNGYLTQTGEPIILGAFAPQFPAQLMTTFSRNYDLAFTEFNGETLGGVIGADNKRRAMIAVVCKTPLDSPREELEESMDHLVDRLKVPGILATMYAADLSAAFEYKRTGTDRDPFFISTLDSNSTLLAASDGGLLWHILPTGEEVAMPVKPLLARVLESLELEEPARVALLTDSDNQACVDMRSTILDEAKGIEINGEPANDAGEEVFQSFSTHTQDTPGMLSNVVTALLSFKPHVIIAATGPEFYEQIYTPFESQWNAATDSAPKPFYIVSPIHFNTPAFASKISALKSRVAGFNAAASSDKKLIKEYLGRFRSEFQGEMNVEGFENFYDAPYFLMYAAAAQVAHTAALRGQDLADGMKRLVDLNAPQFAVGPGRIGAALQALNLGSIRLEGTMGPPDFDERTGGRLTPGSVWCVDSMNVVHSDVLRYDAAVQDLELGTDADGDPLEELPCAATF
jgi:hypothetical protein